MGSWCLIRISVDWTVGSFYRKLAANSSQISNCVHNMLDKVMENLDFWQCYFLIFVSFLLRFGVSLTSRRLHASATLQSIHTNKILNAPELHISSFAFLLNFVWELLQIPLFAEFVDFQYYQVVLHCKKATFGDVVISLVAFAGA